MEPIELIDSCLRKDRRAQARLYEDYAPYSLAVMRRFGVTTRQEKDLLQEIFVEVFAKLNRYDEAKGAFKTWLRQITVFRIIDLQRRDSQLHIVSLDIPEVAEITSAVPLKHLPPEYLRRCIAELPTGYRTVFNLYAIEGFSHKEIAKMLGVTIVTSRSQYHRARQLLQTSCQQYAPSKQIIRYD